MLDIYSSDLCSWVEGSFQSWCGQGIQSAYVYTGTLSVWPVMSSVRDVCSALAKLVWYRPHRPYGMLHPCHVLFCIGCFFFVKSAANDYVYFSLLWNNGLQKAYFLDLYLQPGTGLPAGLSPRLHRAIVEHIVDVPRQPEGRATARALHGAATVNLPVCWCRVRGEHEIGSERHLVGCR